MTTFQLVALGFFGVMVFAVYRAQLLSAVRSVFGRLSPAQRAAVPGENNPPAAINLVQDLLTVNDLRERLAAVGCQEGVDTCTNLLRVMIEFDPNGQN